MNLTNFLKQTDAIAAQYSSVQLIAFIHDIGRVLPEDKREDFLKRLKAAGEEIKEHSRKKDTEDAAFKKLYRRVKSNLQRIASQEIAVDSILNEEYDDWYNSSCEEFLYEDREGVSDMLSEACDFIHTSMDREYDKEGMDIGCQLFRLQILCTSEYGDEELSIQDMVYHNLLNCDLEQVILDTLYCAYRAVPMKDRSGVLYEIFVNAGKSEVTLEAVMQHGEEELPDFREFLVLWIAYLGERTGSEAGRFVKEAVSLLNDASAAVSYAKKYVSVHPGIYLDILENEKNADANSMVSIGIQAMNAIPKNFMIRSEVALKTAEYVVRVNEKQSLLEMCYFVAYESDTSAVNYMRALLNGYGSVKKRGELRKVFMTTNRSRDSYAIIGRSYTGSEREENRLDKNRLLLLRFLDGQFADVLAKGLNESEALGWTGTFMKQGIALYLLYLYEGEQLGQGMSVMADMGKNAMGFSKKEYQRGLYMPDDINEKELFYRLFSEWKSMMQMPPEIRTRAIEKIEGLLEKRTEGIMSGNHRNYYGECAAYIAALGEMKESLGEFGAKQRLMTSYKDKYSRRSAFRAEMQVYGWINIKKKS